MKKLNKLMATLMAIMMIVTMMPVSVFAVEPPDNTAAVTLITDTIKTTLVDGVEQKGSSKTFDVIARDKDGNKICSTVTLNGEIVKANWDDTDKTSYTLNFTQKGENIVIVTARDAKIQYKIDYSPAKQGEIIGTATWSVEGFSIGKGYFVKPIEMNIYEGYNAAQHLEKLLTEHGLRFDYTGWIDKSFYIAGLYDGEFDKRKMWEKPGGYRISESQIITTPSAITTSPSAIGFTLNDSDEPDLHLPAEVKNLLDLNCVNIDLSSYGRDDNNGHYGIGEFDFTNGSGWMYTINNVFPNVGFADSYPADGDVVRVQFTMLYGSDIGGASAMGGGGGTPSVDGAIDVANKDMLTYAIAKKGYDNVSDNDIETVINIASKQSDVDAAVKNIMGSSEGGASDKAAPVLSELKSERISSSKAKIEFNGDEEGTFYYAVVEKDAENITADTNGLGAAMTPAGNSFTIDNLDSQSAKDVYIVARDKNKNISGAVRIPVKEYIDTYAPVLSDMTSSRTGKETATVKFTADEAGTCYYSVAEKDAQPPVVGTAGTGIAMVAGENKISISNLSSGTEKDVYITAKDIKGYESQAYKITVGKYIEPDMAIVEKAMKHLDNTLAYMLKTVPAPVQETTAGDWTVMTLARAGYTVPEGYYEGWKNVVDQLMIDKKGDLHSAKYTEYSRLMLPINALGYNPADVGGYNVLAKYADFSKLKRQGVNGPIWALIALDTNNYLIDADALAKVIEANRNSRTKMIQYTLDKEIEGGGFALSGTKPDPDMTAMAIQSFIPYYNGNDLLKAEFGVDLDGYNKMIADVKCFVERGLKVLSKIQRDEGDYSSWGTVNSESTAQVLVALVGLGIDPMKDDRFIKNGKTLLDGIMKYAVEGGGFAHTYNAGDAGLGNGGGTVNGMATDQSGYALVAYKRFMEGKNYLYDMTDVPKTERPDTFAPNIFNVKSERTGNTTAEITFRINEPGAYYYSVENPNVDTSGEGIIVKEMNNVKENNTISINNLADNKSKKVYIVAKDRLGNMHKTPIEIKINAVVGVDETAPVLSALSSERTGKATATVKFTSDEAGTYYYSVVEKDAQAPVIDTTVVGTVMVTGQNTISISNLSGEAEKDIYITSKDENDNPMSMPVKTTIAKYTEGPIIPPVDEYAKERKAAKTQLKSALDRCDESDYTNEDWKDLLAAYEEGIKSIDSAQPTDILAKEIYDALNKAILVMDSVPVNTNREITVCVSMDANTIGLGYLIKPTLVKIPKYEKASVVITDLLRENGYKWENTGTISNSFYLAQVMPVNQKNVVISDYILKAAGENSILYEDKNDKALGEFDYHSMSGWMYSVSDGSKYPSFPGVGAASWRMVNGEVMRWQFTVYGYGADLNADNKQWGSSSIVPGLGDKTDLTWAVAVLRNKYDDKDLEKNETYKKAMEVLTNPKVGQGEINKIKSELGKVNFEVIIGSTGVNTGSENTVTITPSSTISTNTATSTVSNSEAKKAVEEVKNKKAEEFIIAPEIKKDVDKVVVKLPKTAISGLADDTEASITVKSDLAVISISNEALSSISNTYGTTVNITAERLNKDKLSKENQELVGDKPVFEFKINVDNKEVTSFSGKITINLPYVPGKDEDINKLTVYYIDKNGKAVEMKGTRYDKNSKSVVFVTEHFSTFAIVYDKNKVLFEDVNETDWFYPSVNFVTSNGLFKGVTETMFKPNDSMTRGMLVTSLYRMAGSPKVKSGNKFIDVEDGAWYEDAVVWAYENKIVSGYKDNVFGTNDNITREQIAAILYRYAMTKGYNTTVVSHMDEFTDKDKISLYAQDSMEWAVTNKIIGGRSKNIIAPKTLATRAEVSTMLMRFAENIVK